MIKQIQKIIEPDLKGGYSPEKYSPIYYEDKKKYISLYKNLDCQSCESQICFDNTAECRKFPTIDYVIRAMAE